MFDDERSRRAAAAREVATLNGYTQSVIDRAASYNVDMNDPLAAVQKAAAAEIVCEHAWHCYGIMNGKEDWACQLCGATR